jgi:hypothetical protein
MMDISQSSSSEANHDAPGNMRNHVSSLGWLVAGSLIHHLMLTWQYSERRMNFGA